MKILSPYLAKQTIISCFAFGVAILSCFSSEAGEKGTQGKSTPLWNSSPFEHFSFVETAGQYDTRHTSGKKVLYYAMVKGTETFFTSSGLTFVHYKHHNP